VIAALTAGGADPARVARKRVLSDAVTTAAAAALGVEVGQIANSLVFDADGAPLLVLTSGAPGRHRQGRRAHLVQPCSPSRAGLRPCGDRPGHWRRRASRSSRTDPDARRPGVAQYDEVWAARGVARAVFPSTFAELLAVTGGEPADVA
jgi:hypothetical protein